MLKRGQKYDVLQFMTGPKNRYKYAKDLMQEMSQQRSKEASSGWRSQTSEGPSTMLKRDPKYGFLQFRTSPKTVYKYAQNIMQNEATKRAIT